LSIKYAEDWKEEKRDKDVFHKKYIVLLLESQGVFFANLINIKQDE
jgi:hypothetical protein